MKRVRLPRLHCALLGLLPMLPEDRGRRVVRLVWPKTEVGERSGGIRPGVAFERKGMK